MERTINIDEEVMRFLVPIKLLYLVKILVIIVKYFKKNNVQ